MKHNTVTEQDKERIEGLEVAIHLYTHGRSLDDIWLEGAEVVRQLGSGGKDFADGIYAFLTLMDKNAYPYVFGVEHAND